MNCVKTFHNLNLTNFESSNAVNCQYILTSPRSLKACRKAGIKPVELLFRSLSDFEDELGISSEQVYEFYRQHERDRQCKIEICKSIRNKLLIVDNKYQQNEKQCLHKLISRKEQLDRENLQKASSLYGNEKGFSIPVTSSRLSNTHSSTSASPSLGNSKVDSSYKNLLCEVGTCSGVCDSSSGASSLSTGTPGTNKNTDTPKKLKFEKKSSPKTCTPKTKLKSKKKFNSPMRASWDYDINDDFIIDNPKSVKRNSLHKKNNCNKNDLYQKNINAQLKTLKPESVSSSVKSNLCKKAKAVKNNNHYNQFKDGNNVRESQIKKTKNGFNKENIINLNKVLKNGCSGNKNNNNTYYQGNKKSVMKWSLPTTCYSRLQNLTPFYTSSVSLGVPQNKRKHILYDFMNIDNLSIPENDRKILETLALKKEQERESEEFAHQAHQLWERKQQERLMAENEQKYKWQKYVQEKRKTESMQNLMRMEEIKQSLRESQSSLEERLKQRDKKVAELKKQNDEKKLTEIFDRRDQASRRKAVVDANYKQKIMETELVQQKHQEELQQRLERAECTRTQTRQSIHRRVASANRMEELRHQENMLEVVSDQELLLQQKKREIRERQSRARERYTEQLRHREKHVKESSAEQRLRALQVKEIHRDLDQGLEQWQDQVMLLQWADSQRAEASVQTQIENRRLRLEIENKERQLLHIQRMQKVKQAENSRKQNIRETIQAKEKRINILQQRREKEINEGRIQAQTTADLREHLRRTLSPETFDRKVARAAIEMRIGSRPVTASPTMMRSHIYLG